MPIQKLAYACSKLIAVRVGDVGDQDRPLTKREHSELLFRGKG